MIRLSERMEHIVELAKPEQSGEAFSCVAEVGCDHAYITMEIVKRGYAKKGIAMDVKEGPLRRAMQNIEEEFNFVEVKQQRGCGQAAKRIANEMPHGGKVDTRLSDGLSKLNEGEADLLVIAGMGGELMCRILEEGRRISDSIPVWILQPQTECYELRKYLCSRNFLITREDMVLEDGKFYPMLRAVHKESSDMSIIKYGAQNGSGWNTEEGSGCAKREEIKMKYGPLLLEEKNPCLLKYLLWKENVNRELFGLLHNESSPKAAKRKRELEKEYIEIQEAKGFFY